MENKRQISRSCIEKFLHQNNESIYDVLIFVHQHQQFYYYSFITFISHQKQNISYRSWTWANWKSSWTIPVVGIRTLNISSSVGVKFCAEIRSISSKKLEEIKNEIQNNPHSYDHTMYEKKGIFICQTVNNFNHRTYYFAESVKRYSRRRR